MNRIDRSLKSWASFTAETLINSSRCPRRETAPRNGSQRSAGVKREGTIKAVARGANGGWRSRERD